MTCSGPDFSASLMAGSSCSGAVKITEIGCSCVMVRMPVWSLACTMLPGSTSRKPARPVSGDSDGGVGELNFGAVDGGLVGLDLRRQAGDLAVR